MTHEPEAPGEDFLFQSWDCRYKNASNNYCMPDQEKVKLTANFEAGFETGIFLRDKPEEMKSYSC